jgi:hypothetical protein
LVVPNVRFLVSAPAFGDRTENDEGFRRMHNGSHLRRRSADAHARDLATAP